MQAGRPSLQKFSKHRNISLPQDDPDLHKIREMQIQGCGCKNSCVSSFSDDVVYTQGIFLSTTVKKQLNGGRKTSNVKMCKKTFMLAYDIGKHLLQNITTHMNIHGVTPLKHGNHGGGTQPFTYTS